MAKKTGAGRYRRRRKAYRLVFTNPQLRGLIVWVRPVRKAQRRELLQITQLDVLEVRAYRVGAEGRRGGGAWWWSLAGEHLNPAETESTGGEHLNPADVPAGQGDVADVEADDRLLRCSPSEGEHVKRRSALADLEPEWADTRRGHAR